MILDSFSHLPGGRNYCHLEAPRTVCQDANVMWFLPAELSFLVALSGLSGPEERETEIEKGIERTNQKLWF